MVSVSVICQILVCVCVCVVLLSRFTDRDVDYPSGMYFSHFSSDTSQYHDEIILPTVISVLHGSLVK